MAIDARKHGNAVAVNQDLELGPAGRRVPVQIVLDPHGLTIRRRGRRLALYADWDRLLVRMLPPENGPAKYLSNPAGLLVDEAPNGEGRP